LRLWVHICLPAWLRSVVSLGCATYCGAIRSAAHQPCPVPYSITGQG